MTPVEALGRILEECEDALSKCRLETDFAFNLGYVSECVKQIRTYATAALPTPEPGDVVCGRCSGTGLSSRGNRPDDHGPHLVCTACDGGRVKVEVTE